MRRNTKNIILFKQCLNVVLCYNIDGSNCGVQRPGLDPEANIVGGKDAQPGEWPWQGLIYNNGQRWCGASLLTPEWAVTSGFCM